MEIEVLILEKQRTNVIDKHIWNKYSQEVIIDFLKEWKKQNNSKRAYEYFERLKLKYDNEAKQKYINELLKLTSK